MEIWNKVGRYEFLAEPFHCDFSHHLFMGYLGNHLLNAADYHSADRGYGLRYLNDIHRTWVLSRLAIEMEKMPAAYDRFAVETWVDGVLKSFTSRNYAITDVESHEVYGYGKSIWAMIDTQTRQPVDILSIQDGLIGKYIEKGKVCPIAKPSRVAVGPDVRKLRTVATYYSDVDVNGHINSVKYIEHILDFFSLDYYRRNTLRRIEVAYVAESHQSDLLNLYGEEVEDRIFAFRITKTVPGSREEVEVVRSMVKFVKD